MGYESREPGGHRTLAWTGRYDPLPNSPILPKQIGLFGGLHPPQIRYSRFQKGQHWRQRKPFWDKEWLEHQYLVLKRSSQDIADDFGIGDTAIQYWLGKHGIPTRDVSQARSIKHWGLSGPDNPMYGKRGSQNHNWKGGLTPERQKEYSRPEVQKFLTSIRKREKGRCKRCGERAHLDVHHIRSWSTYPDLRYVSDNCVALCKQCHLWVHSLKNERKEYLAE